MENEKKNKNKISNDNVYAIRAVISTKNRFEYQDKLFELLKFEVKTYVPKTFRRRKNAIIIKININATAIILLLFAISLIFIILLKLVGVLHSLTAPINYDRSTNLS